MLDCLFRLSSNGDSILAMRQLVPNLLATIVCNLDVILNVIVDMNSVKGAAHGTWCIFGQPGRKGH